MGDQFFWGTVLHQRGAAVRPVHCGDLGRVDLAASLVALRDEGLRRRCVELAPTLAAEDGVAAAVASIEPVAPSGGA